MAAVAADPAAEESTLLVLCRLCVVGLSVTGAALVLRSSAGVDRVVAATDGTAAVEDLQFDLGEGPGVDAARDGPVLTPDLTVVGDRWPVFAPAAAGAGVAAVFAFPLRVDGVTIGVLDLYRATPGGMTDQALRRRGPPRPPSCCYGCRPRPGRRPRCTRS